MKNILYKLIRKIVYTVLWILYPLTFIIPRNKNIWLFGCGMDRYADNAKYMFEYIAENEENIKSYWISGRKEIVNHVNSLGYKGVWRYSFKGMLLALRAKVYIFSSYVIDINMWLCRGALKLNLWHGVGFQANEKYIDRGPLRKLYSPKNLIEKIYSIIHSPHIWIKSFYLVSPSQLMSEIQQEAFGLPPEKMLVTSYPRLSALFEQTPMPDEWTNFDYIVLYMPTKRPDMDGFINDAFPNPEEFNRVCRENNLLFVYKLHPLTSTKALDRLKGYSHLSLLDKSLDINPLLNHTSALVTDFSSIHADYAILKKPILFYAPDLASYKDAHPPFTIEYDKITKDCFYSSFEAFYTALKDFKLGSMNSDHIIDLYWETDPKMSREEIANWIKTKIS